MTDRDKALAALAAHHARITEARAALKRLEAVELPLIADARNEGATWKQVGEAVGKTAQNAFRDYDRRLHKDVQRHYTVKTSEETTDGP